jgi:hypothetical protein
MIVPLAFWLFLLGALSIGWHAGDRPDRQVILAIGLAAVLTAAADVLLDFLPSLIIVCAIDLALLAIVARYALTSERYWPIWFAGIHGAATFVALVALLLPQGQRAVLDLLSGSWAIPALLVLVGGLLADKRCGIRAADH